MEKRFVRLLEIMQYFLEIDGNPAARKLCPEIAERSDYLLRRGSIVQPIMEHNDTVFEWDSPLSPMDYKGTKEKSANDLKIYPFLPEDSALGPITEKITGHDFAVYGASCHFIAINVKSYETDIFVESSSLIKKQIEQDRYKVIEVVNSELEKYSPNILYPVPDVFGKIEFRVKDFKGKFFLLGYLDYPWLL